MRTWIILFACVLQVWSDSTTTTRKVQLQSIIVNSNDNNISPFPNTTFGCKDITTVDFGGVSKLIHTCSGSLTLGKPTEDPMIVVISNSNGIIKDPSTANISWTISFNNSINNNILPLSAVVTPSYDGSLQMSTSILNVTFSNNNYTVNTTTQITAFTEKFQKTTNSAAVVVAVLEGLILLAIIVVVSYKVCFAKNKMNNFGGGGGGSASYSANPYGTSGAGVSYGTGPANGSFYDGAAAAYRRDNNQEGNTTTMRNEGYGYDQPLPRPEERTSQTAQNQNRVQTESPSLVPVPLGGADPLNQWGDQRRPDPFA